MILKQPQSPIRKPPSNVPLVRSSISASLFIGQIWPVWPTFPFTGRAPTDIETVIFNLAVGPVNSCAIGARWDFIIIISDIIIYLK